MTDQQMLTLEARNKTAIERSFTAWADGTGSPFDLLAENASWTIVGHSIVSKRYENREAFMREVIRYRVVGPDLPGFGSRICRRVSSSSTRSRIWRR